MSTNAAGRCAVKRLGLTADVEEAVRRNAVTPAAAAQMLRRVAATWLGHRVDV